MFTGNNTVVICNTDVYSTNMSHGIIVSPKRALLDISDQNCSVIINSQQNADLQISVVSAELQTGRSTHICGNNIIISADEDIEYAPGTHCFKQTLKTFMVPNITSVTFIYHFQEARVESFCFEFECE